MSRPTPSLVERRALAAERAVANLADALAQVPSGAEYTAAERVAVSHVATRWNGLTMQIVRLCAAEATPAPGGGAA